MKVVYRFEVPGCLFKDGRIALNVNYHIRGKCVAEVSVDGESWQPVASQGEVGGAEAVLPEGLFPTKTIYLKLRADGNGSFQVDRVEFDGGLDGSAPDGAGKTVYAELDATHGDLIVDQIAMCDASAGTGASLLVTVRNRGTRAVRASVAGREEEMSSEAVGQPTYSEPLSAQRTTSMLLKLPAKEPGDHTFNVMVWGPDVKADTIRARVTYTVPDYYRTDYGQLLGIANGTALWWAQGTHKIPRNRAVPAASGTGSRERAAVMGAARNDWEGVQIVVRPEKELKGLTATASEFRQVNGDGVIGADRIQVLRAYYHFVDHPTDSTGVRDYWPDALPRLDGPIDVGAGQNQPLWVLVHVPEDAKPGDYQGDVEPEGGRICCRSVDRFARLGLCASEAEPSGDGVWAFGGEYLPIPRFEDGGG